MRGRTRTTAGGPIAPSASKQTRTWRAAVLDALQQGLSVNAACVQASVSPDVALRHRPADTTFTQAWDDAVRAADARGKRGF